MAQAHQQRSIIENLVSSGSHELSSECLTAMTKYRSRISPGVFSHARYCIYTLKATILKPRHQFVTDPLTTLRPPDNDHI